MPIPLNIKIDFDPKAAQKNPQSLDSACVRLFEYLVVLGYGTFEVEGRPKGRPLHNIRLKLLVMTDEPAQSPGTAPSWPSE